VKSLYLDGSGAYATTPAVDFHMFHAKGSFTIASWVKLQSPVKRDSPIYADWSDPYKFIVYGYTSESVLFGVINNEGQFRPWLGAG